MNQRPLGPQPSALLGCAPAQPEKRPAYSAHHRAKHELLRRYMDVWMPKLGFTYDQVALVDGFASAGRYREEQRGSPLIMLDAYVGRSAADRARFQHPPHFVFIESKRSFARHLKAEVEEQFPRVVEYLATAYRQPVPTFAFVDPRGYADNPFSRIEDFKRRMPDKSEVMVYLPASFMARFLATGKTDAALTKVYGGPTWEQAAEMDERALRLGHELQRRARAPQQLLPAVRV